MIGKMSPYMQCIVVTNIGQKYHWKITKLTRGGEKGKIYTVAKLSGYTPHAR